VKFKEALDKAVTSWLKEVKGVDATDVEINDDSYADGCTHHGDSWIEHDTTIRYTREDGKRDYDVQDESLLDFLTRLEDYEI
jgi:hypothetical protein